jgi:signal transduction histidine kinase
MTMQCNKCGGALPLGSESYSCSCDDIFCLACASYGQSICTHCGHELTRRQNPNVFTALAHHHVIHSYGQHGWLIWGLSFGVWIFIAFASGFSMYEFQRSLGRYTTLRDELILPLVQSLIFAVLTPFVFHFATRYPVQRENWIRRSGLHLVAAMIFAVIHVAIRAIVYPVWDADVRGFAWPLWNSQSHALRFKWKLIERLFFYNTVEDISSAYLPIVLVAFGVVYYRRFRERELRATELEGQLAQAHLHELKSQLQPHFLFNTLHSISALMHIDVKAADKMMTYLSDLLRLSLENTGIQITTLKMELEFVNGYLAIEKIRFGERLKIVMDIPAEMLSAETPHLILQPLVENAIRHGISKRSAEGKIYIAASHDGDHLSLLVRDNGPGLAQQPPRPGLGLEATRKRLQTLYGDDQSLEVRNTPETGVEVCIRIPFSAPARLLNNECTLSDLRSA